MPVDKFGHTDSGSMQRVVAGGVTLTQVNNTFAKARWNERLHRKFKSRW